ncbi:AzlD domain-containing protein [Haloarchaeobius litoreus]|uniref:AzlD domain-containing protein n=1 Tax=Haloarchaeobius litoreus TaxID=755306 RepID=A0ABD6DG82_9EURY|nr:AzlD domain-containing protein [Haloarchaeobius litoreus]
MSYDATTLWGIVAAVGVITLALRLSFILLFGRVDDIPNRVERTLELVPAAVLAALVVPAVVALDTSLALQAEPAKVVAAVVAAAVAWRTENVLATIAVGMGALWLVGMVV